MACVIAWWATENRRSQSCGLRRYESAKSDSENVGGNQLAETQDVAVALKLETDLADTAEEEVQLAVEVEGAGGLYRVGLHLAVGKGGEVHLLAGDSLYVDGDNALVGEDYGIADGLECSDDVFALYQQGAHSGHEGCRVYRGELEEAAVLEVNHSIAD